MNFIDFDVVGECVRVLLVSDPQILGFERELWIARYDSDRHLRQTFLQAFYHVKPHAIIFLGDLTDEGEIADEKTFRKYYLRFKRIFNLPENVETINIPGDNDIGGEWPMEMVNIDQFENYYGNASSWTLGSSLKVFSVNLITKEQEIKKSDNSNSTHILISHYSMLRWPNLESNNAIARLNPTIIFSGHDHTSRIIPNEMEHDKLKNGRGHNVKIFDLKLLKEKKKIVEIQVTTCSYRMGTLTIGYAQAIFDQDKMKYSPMFFVSRFYQLAFYVIFFFLVVLVNIFIKRKSFRNFHKYERLSDKNLGQHETH